MTALRFLLTKDPVLVVCLPPHIRCFVGIDEHWHETTDELVIEDITGGSRGLSIAERLNLQNRLELRFLKLQWIPTSQSDIDELVCDANDDEVLEKLQPSQSLEHFVLVKYAGHAFPIWMMNNMITVFPYLVSLCLFHLQNCNDLPPLGNLRNLRYLHIKGMPNLRNLEMGLSGGPQPLKKLTHLKLETLMNLKELPILFPTDTEDQDFMFPLLEELSVLSCSQLVFKPSLPRCKRYEIKESNNILSCGEPLGPSSSPSPTKIEISGCLVSSSWLQWLNSTKSLKKVVIVECVGDDGAALISSEFWEIKGTQEPASTKIPHETKNEISPGTNISTQDGAHKVTGSGSSIIRKPFPRFNTTSANSAESVHSFESTSPEKILPTPQRIPPSPSRFAPSPQMATVGSVNLTVQQILRATQNFSPSFKLGKGGFGMVYRAVLADGQVVAVKRAQKDQFVGPRDEFTNEVEFLAKIYHQNLVRLLGFIEKGNERIIITEYVPNGTLREHLDGQHGRVLDFNQRLEIATDIAHALTYLHLYADKKIKIIHGDLTSSNILLTDSYRAKVSDFGFARSRQAHISTNLKGTSGYLDPEYLRTYQLTPKSDVFSFGILLIEIISGRPVDLKRTPKERIIKWTFKKFDEGNIREILDPLLEDHVDDRVLENLLVLAFHCAGPSGEDRPTMKDVGVKLWGIRNEYGKSVGGAAGKLIQTFVQSCPKLANVGAVG